MHLSTLQLLNYRRFDRLKIDFHPRLTVIVARNGQGKTTVLEALASALGPFVGAFDTGRAEHIRRTDARYTTIGNGFENEQVFPVEISATLNNPNLSWQRALRSAKGRTTIREASPLANWGKQLQAELREGGNINLPVICYYSSKRLWVSHKNVNTKAILTKSRTAGYEDCLSALSSFTQLQQWMRKASLAVLQQRDQPGYSHSNLSERLTGIQHAVDSALESEGWQHFHYSHVFEELAMVHKDHGALPISLLSDGVRAMISLVADLALRCVRLNAHLGAEAPKISKGVVLIDEVDLHLHPAWQQHVLKSLRDAFPNVQFITSTHSPQVLSTVKSENIRVIYQSGQNQWFATTPREEVQGIESAIALNNVMGVNPIPPIPEAGWVADYITKIENASHNEPEGKALRQQLISLYGKHHPVLLNADRLIRFQEFKLKKSKQKE